MKLEDIKEGSYIKKRTMIFLVKGLEEIASDKYQHYKKDRRLESKYTIKYHFAISTKKKHFLHKDSSSKPISEYDLEKDVRLATKEEIEILNNAIIEENPYHNNLGSNLMTAINNMSYAMIKNAEAHDRESKNTERLIALLEEERKNKRA